jgi:hypothetical protein
LNGEGRDATLEAMAVAVFSAQTVRHGTATLGPIRISWSKHILFVYQDGEPAPVYGDACDLESPATVGELLAWVSQRTGRQLRLTETFQMVFERHLAPPHDIEISKHLRIRGTGDGWLALIEGGKEVARGFFSPAYPWRAEVILVDLAATIGCNVLRDEQGQLALVTAGPAN